MPVSKLGPSRGPYAMKPEGGNDYIDTIIRQAIDRESLFTFSRAGDNPVHWIQLLRSFDQPADLPGWPFLTPLKVQMQKCDKCSQEFCSSINYRRHIRVHRRSLNVDKESHKNRNFLAAFWDKLSVDEAKELVSFKDVNLEDVPGSSIIKALTSFIRKPGFCVLPQVYARAGSVLLDIIQASRSSLAVSSQELFNILDDASERTFLCAGTAESMQKYVFDRETSKIALETKNLIACTSFLLEQKLVKAWLADKDAEALRCQKLLVEEEEAAQRRQAAVLERKRQKKLRQKEQKAKDQTNCESMLLQDGTIDACESPPFEQTSNSLTLSEPNLCTVDSPSDHVPALLEFVHFSNNEEEAAEAQMGLCGEHGDSSNDHNIEPQSMHGNNRRRVVIARWKVPKSRSGQNGLRTSQHLQVMKVEAIQKHGPMKDSRVSPTVIGSRVWTRKAKTKNDENLRNRVQETTNQNNSKVIIGSISVPVTNCTAPLQRNSGAEVPNYFSTEQALHKYNVQEKLTKPNPDQCDNSQSTMKLWGPVRRLDTGEQLPVQSGNEESEGDATLVKYENRTVHGENDLQIYNTDSNDCVNENNSHLTLEENEQSGGLLLSSLSARAFLAQRWKEAILADHVKLDLSPVPDPPGCSDVQDDSKLQSLASENCTLGNTEEDPADVGSLEFSTSGNARGKFRSKPGKGTKVKYIPKWKKKTVA